MEQANFIKINPADNVVVCLKPLAKGETIAIDGRVKTSLSMVILLAMLSKT